MVSPAAPVQVNVEAIELRVSINIAKVTYTSCFSVLRLFTSGFFLFINNLWLGLRIKLSQLIQISQLGTVKILPERTVENYTTYVVFYHTRQRQVIPAIHPDVFLLAFIR
jgi:hypothetical protein